MKQFALIVFLVVMGCTSRDAAAFWGGESTDAASGLNVTAGFDVNTITTILGRVVTAPERKGQEQHTLMSVNSTQGTVIVVLGPWAFWEKQTVAFTANQDVSVTGSLAQGKDGARYVFAQRIENISAGESVTLRSDSGKPLWSGTGTGSQNGARQFSGNGPRWGSGSRGARGGRR